MEATRMYNIESSTYSQPSSITKVNLHKQQIYLVVYNKKIALSNTTM